MITSLYFGLILFKFVFLFNILNWFILATISAADLQADDVFLGNHEPSSGTSTPDSTNHIIHVDRSPRRVTVTLPDVEEPSAPEQLPVLPEGWGERQVRTV